MLNSANAANGIAKPQPRRAVRTDAIIVNSEITGARFGLSPHGLGVGAGVSVSRIRQSDVAAKTVPALVPK
jgi:hypothetical protein